MVEKTKKILIFKIVLAGAVVAGICFAARRYEQRKIEQYVFINYSKTYHCAMVHTDKNCGKSQKFVFPSADLIHTARRIDNQWEFKCDGVIRTFNFCGKCFSAQKVDSYTEEIEQYRLKIMGARETMQEDIDYMTRTRDRIAPVKQKRPRITKPKRYGNKN